MKGSVFGVGERQRARFELRRGDDVGGDIFRGFSVGYAGSPFTRLNSDSINGPGYLFSGHIKLVVTGLNSKPNFSPRN